MRPNRPLELLLAMMLVLGCGSDVVIAYDRKLSPLAVQFDTENNELVMVGYQWAETADAPEAQWWLGRFGTDGSYHTMIAAGSDGLADVATALAVTKNGNAIFAGHSDTADGRRMLWVREVGLRLDEVWATALGPYERGTAVRSIAVAPDGTIAVAANYHDDLGPDDLLLVQLASTGAKQSELMPRGQDNGGLRPRAMGVSPNGQTVVTGFTLDGGRELPSVFFFNPLTTSFVVPYTGQTGRAEGVLTDSPNELTVCMSADGAIEVRTTALESVTATSQTISRFDGGTLELSTCVADGTSHAFLLGTTSAGTTWVARHNRLQHATEWSTELPASTGMMSALVADGDAGVYVVGRDRSSVTRVFSHVTAPKTQ